MSSTQLQQQGHKDVRAFVFDKMVEHFQVNSDAVQNIDVMNVAGFCRNCLSKWYLAGCRRFGVKCSYDEACEIVYGIPYGEWKTKYQKKATAEQLEKFNATKSFHAQHPDFKKHKEESEAESSAEPSQKPIMSDVCCEGPEGDQCALDMVKRIAQRQQPSSSEKVKIRFGILTVSDRASQGVYRDESGPEIRACFEGFASHAGTYTSEGDVEALVVQDDVEDIKKALVALSANCNLVITTGGTGLAKRDVTPEATLQVIQREVRGIPEAIRRETSKIEPMAVLSRAVAGIRNDSCLIINLPGRPKACREAMAVILPIIHQAVSVLSS